MKKFLLLIFLILAVFQVKAQRNFQPGYILQHADTVKGWVSFRKPKTNAEICLFKSDLKAKVQKFKASEITGYGLSEGRHFRAYLIPETSKAFSSDKPAPKYYFLNVMVAGKANLFFVRDISGKDRFFIKKDTVFKELESKEITIRNSETGGLYKGSSKLYAGTLTYLMNDCRNLQPTINSTNFKSTSLTKTFKTYNQCISPDSLYFVQKPVKSKTTFGITAGPNYTFIKFSAPYKTTELAADYNRTPGFSAGLSLNNTLPFLNENLSFQTELLFFQSKYIANYSFNKQYIPYLSPSPEERSEDYFIKANVLINTLKLPIQFRYTFPIKRFKPYLNTGIAINADLQVKDQGWIEAYDQHYYVSKPFSGYNKRKIYAGFVAGTGVTYQILKGNSINLDLKYLPNDLNTLYQLSSGISTWSLTTGFTF